MIKNILTLLVNFLQIGLFSIGGGYAIIPLIQERVVDSNHWLTLEEFVDIITISQMTPGPLAINTSTFVGIRIAGMLGAVAATFGCILSGFTLSIILYKFFKKNKDIAGISNILKGLRSTSVGLIAASASNIVLITFLGSTSLDMKTIDFNITAIIVFIISLFLLRKYKMNPILLMILTGVIGIFFYQ